VISGIDGRILRPPVTDKEIDSSPFVRSPNRFAAFHPAAERLIESAH